MPVWLFQITCATATCGRRKVNALRLWTLVSCLVLFVFRNSASFLAVLRGLPTVSERCWRLPGTIRTLWTSHQTRCFLPVVALKHTGKQAMADSTNYAHVYKYVCILKMCWFPRKFHACVCFVMWLSFILRCSHVLTIHMQYTIKWFGTLVFVFLMKVHKHS